MHSLRHWWSSPSGFTNTQYLRCWEQINAGFNPPVLITWLVLSKNGACWEACGWAWNASGDAIPGEVMGTIRYPKKNKNNTQNRPCRRGFTGGRDRAEDAIKRNPELWPQPKFGMLMYTRKSTSLLSAEWLPFLPPSYGCWSTHNAFFPALCWCSPG